MVYLRDLSNQWPWNAASVKDLADKEIYSQMHPSSETSDEWEVPIPPCLPGMAYVGIRITVFGKKNDYSMYPRFMIGKHQLLGHPWDTQHCKNSEWFPLSYPMVPRLFQQKDKGSVTLRIAHNSPCFGKVELLAQKFDDLLEHDSNISYAYYDPILDQIGLIQTPDDLYSADLLESGNVPSYPRRVKILSPLRYILSNEHAHGDTKPYQLGIRVKSPW